MPTGRTALIVAPGQTIRSAEWGNPLVDQSVLCFASAADRTNQWPAPHQGSVSFLEDVQQLHVFIAGVWRLVPATPNQLVRGQSGVNALAAGAAVDTNLVTFAPAFAIAPTVTTGYKGSANANVVVEILTLTTTQVNFRVRNNGGSATTGAVHWIAMA